MSTPEWEDFGAVAVAAATCAAWDRDALPPDFRLDVDAEPPTPPTAIISTIGDDIDAGIQVLWDGEDIVAVRLFFVEDIDEIEEPWKPVGELDVPSGHLVLADPYCTPVEPYRQQLEVRPGRWLAEELYWHGELEGVRLTWAGP